MKQSDRMAQEGAGFQGKAEAVYGDAMGINQKIIAVQNELKAPKGQFNNFGKYKYRSQEDILEALKPLLDKYGLLQTISDELTLVGDRFYIKAQVVVSDGVNLVHVNGFAREPEVKKGMDESQITGTASSYARKYALNGMWLIDDTKDADTDEYQRQKDKQPKPVAKPVKKAKPKTEVSDDDKQWLNEGTKHWTNAVNKIKNREIMAYALRDYYKVSNENMEFFLTLEDEVEAETEIVLDEEQPELPF